MKYSILLLLLFFLKKSKAQGCIEKLEHYQDSFYKANPTIFDIHKSTDALIFRSLPERERQQLDSLNKTGKAGTKFDLPFTNASFKLTSNLIYNSSLITDQQRKTTCIGALPIHDYNAQCIRDENDAFVILDLNLYRCIDLFVDLALRTLHLEPHGQQMEIIFNQAKNYKNNLRDSVALVKLIGNVLNTLNSEELSSNYIELPEPLKYYSSALAEGCHMFLIAHELAHAFMKHSNESTSRSEIWKDELEADYLAFRIFLDAVDKMEKHPDFKNITSYAPEIVLTVFWILESEYFYKKEGKSFLEQTSDSAFINIVSPLGRMIGLKDKKTYIIDPKLDRMDLHPIYESPHPLIRSAALTSHEILHLNRKYATYERSVVTEISRNLRFLWQISRNVE